MSAPEDAGARLAEVLRAATAHLKTTASDPSGMAAFVDSVDDETLQLVLAAAVKAYVTRREDGAELGPLPEDQTLVTATDAAVTAQALLDSVGVEVFELSMWGALGSL